MSKHYGKISTKEITMQRFETALEFMVHVLAVFGGIAIAHHFFPGSTFVLFFMVLFAVLLVCHRNNRETSMITMALDGFKKTKQMVKKERKLVDDLPK